MNIIEFRDAVIREAVASVERVETREYRKKGCLKGLEICATLITLEEYEKELEKRHEMEINLAIFREKVAMEEYWEFRCATAQLEFVYERLKVAYGASSLSAAALLQYARIVGVKDRKST